MISGNTFEWTFSFQTNIMTLLQYIVFVWLANSSF